MEFLVRNSSNCMQGMYPNRKLLASDLVSDLGASKSIRCGNTNPRMINNIRTIRKSLSLSMEKVAERAGTTKATIMKLERGDMQLTVEWMKRIAIALRVNVKDLIDEPAKKVRVLGYVGAGAEVFVIDDPEVILEEVDPPTGYTADNIVAVRVRGDSMEPQLEDGWLLFYRRDSDGVPPECVGELCVVRLENNGMLVKKLRQGSKPGHFHLMSKNSSHEPMFDQRLLWAARVIDIRPC